MKALSLLRVGLPLLLLSPALLAQGAKPAAPKESTAAAAPPATEPKKSDPGPAADPAPEGSGLRGAEKLTVEQQKQLVTGMGEVANYIRGVRNLEALEKLDELERMAGPTHFVENLRGAVYTKMRNFAKARTHFQKAADLAKGLDKESFHPKFNLAELNFVEAGNGSAKLREVPPRAGVNPADVAKQWAAAHESFTKLLKEPGLTETDTITLINFKLYVCDLQLKKAADAEVILTSFDQFDAVAPAYYYARAVQYFMKDDKDGAQEWLDSAKRIYPKETNEVYNDSLVELGWLETLQ